MVKGNVFSSAALPGVFKITGFLVLILLQFSRLMSGTAWAADPTVSIAAPSNEFGDVGAALGNVWDMNSVGDVAWTQPNASGQMVQYTQQAAGAAGVPAGAYGSVLHGVAPKGSDLATAFYANSSVSIPSGIYHYLIYRSAIAPHQAGEAGKEPTNARILYASQWGLNWLAQAFPFRRYSRPQQVQVCPPGSSALYGKWCTYFIDLAQNINGSGSPNPWDWGQPGASVKAFGLWPHENWCDSNCNPSGDSPNYFYLDFVYLTGEIVAKHPGYLYTVRWNVADSDGGQVTSTLYYQERDEILTPAQSPSCNASNLASSWTQFGTSTLTLSAAPSQNRIFLPVIFKPASGNSFGSGVVGPYNQSFDWNLSSGAYVEGKVYYVCVRVHDGTGEGYQVSSAPVIKAPPPTVLLN